MSKIDILIKNQAKIKITKIISHVDFVFIYGKKGVFAYFIGLLHHERLIHGAAAAIKLLGS